ncbi:ATPase [Streptomyces sp. AJS327]|uniref:AAA family ATPase n=1 Tax=Streptomyces sp. AJS327 TaxID=2545265 RepID=UPI0015DF45CE|nr:AAA family ATPase [Streptomyces sp. AJS327]MBA0052249.1 ATPase [Streptomyces sp. AJS327]
MTVELIGREHPTALLRGETARAAASHGGLVLVTGEAGIGKTALVTRIAEEARRNGSLVVGGACWASGSAPGYWPWTQTVRALRRAATPEEWRAVEEAASAADLAVLLGGEPGTPAPAGSATPAGASGTPAGGGESAPAGFRLYDAVTTALVAASQHRPVLVLLEDLHWADPESLRLLEFAAQHTWFERLLLVGTYRDVEGEAPGHPLRPLLLPLVAKATTLTLTGLDDAGASALITRTTGTPPEPALVAEVLRRTGGNPFFIEQTARLWHSGGSVSAVAPGVSEAVRRRLSLLPEPVAELLATAAVLGRRFHRALLAAVAGQPVAHADRLLDQALAARLVVAEEEGRFSFAHDLVREALHDTLGSAEARALHAAAVRAVVGNPALAGRVLPAELARHAHLAGPALDPGQAAELQLAAAEDAEVRYAVEEAIGHRRRALERIPVTDVRARFRYTVGLGTALQCNREWEESWRVLGEAVELARGLDDAEPLARAALTLYGGGYTGSQGKLVADLIGEAHEALAPGEPTGHGGPEPPGGRAPHVLAEELSEHLTAVARGGLDDEMLSFGLSTRHDLIWGPGTAAERQALTEEILTVARRSGDQSMAMYASALRWVALLEQDDPRYLHQLDEQVALARRLNVPRLTVMADADRTLVDAHRGEVGRVARLLEGIPELTGERRRLWDSVAGLHIRWSLALLRGEEGRAEELLGPLTAAGHPATGLLGALCAAHRGDAAVAVGYLRGEYARHERPERQLPRAVVPLWLRFQAEAAVLSGEEDLLARARDDLAPYAREWCVSFYGCDIGGPVVLWLAQLDAALDRVDAAVEGFGAALAAADRLCLHAWSAEARVGLAHVLRERGLPGDRERSEALYAEVERVAGEMGMVRLAGRARAALRAGAPWPVAASGPAQPGLSAAEFEPPGTLPGPRVADPGPHAAQPEPSAAEFRREGAVWALRFAGRLAHLPDAKGLRDLRTLLAHPGSEIPAATLLAAGGGPGEAEAVEAHRLGGDALLDERAKAAYRERLQRLDEEIDRAVERGADTRAAELDEERAALLAQLREAAGLAGRTRRLGDQAERARKTVTARIRDTLRKLAGSHPELAAHLRESVTTGTSCRYQPERRVSWRL